jgi:hypothetical protein
MFFSIFGLLKLATVLSAVTVGIVFAQWAITTVGDLAAARRAEREPVGSPE